MSQFDFFNNTVRSNDKFLLDTLSHIRHQSIIILYLIELKTPSITFGKQNRVVVYNINEV